MIFGRKKKAEQEEPEEDEFQDEQVLFQGATNGVEPDLKKNAKLVRAALMPVKQIITDAVSRRAHQVTLEPKGGKFILRMSIDGIPYAAGTLPQQRANAVTQMFKLLAGLDIQNRKQPQIGGLAATYCEKPHHLTIESTPVKGGAEVLRVQIRDTAIKLERPADVGLPDEIKEKIREMSIHRRGIVLVCGPPESGTTTSSVVVLHSVDAYLYQIYSINKNIGEGTLTNVSLFDEDISDLTEIIERLIRKEADVVFLEPIVDAETARIVYEYHDRVNFICEIDASDPAEAMQRMIEWLGPEAAAASIHGIFTQKLVRKLCEPCREAYRPNPKLLQKLGLPPETKVLYRPPSPPADDDPDAPSVEELCDDCDGIPYHGRAAAFELIEVNDAMKEVILAGADPAEVKRVASESDMRSLQTDAIQRLVAEGTTSLEEVQRVFAPKKKRGGKKRRPR